MDFYVWCPWLESSLEKGFAMSILNFHNHKIEKECLQSKGDMV